MTWVRLDDQFLTHPKALRAGKDGRALFVASLCYVAQHELDGRLEGDVVGSLCALADVPTKTARRLVDVGLWDTTEEGYVVHDFLDYNPSRAQLDAEREAGARRKKASRDRRRGHAPASGEAPPGQSPDARQGLASASTDPDPVPYPTTSSSSTTTSAVPQPPDDDDGIARFESAVAQLADRAVARTTATGKHLRNAAGYRHTCLASARTEHGVLLSRLLVEHPDWTSEQLADAIDPPPAPATKADPLDEARRRGVRAADLEDIDAQGVADALANDDQRAAFWAARQQALGGAA